MKAISDGIVPGSCKSLWVAALTTSLSGFFAETFLSITRVLRNAVIAGGFHSFQLIVFIKYQHAFAHTCDDFFGNQRERIPKALEVCVPVIIGDQKASFTQRSVALAHECRREYLKSSRFVASRPIEAQHPLGSPWYYILVDNELCRSLPDWLGACLRLLGRTFRHGEFVRRRSRPRKDFILLLKV